ncbi:MAG: hypothetical protein IKP58_14965 [Victivallales bacterium]|nr:hypothetical protein [Victivallales bacterium]
MSKIFVALSWLLMLTGCYHVGVPGGRAIAFDEVNLTNNTREPALMRQFDMSFKEQVSVTPGVSGKANRDACNYNLDIELVSIRNMSVARAEVRDKKSRDGRDEAYQTVLNRVELTVKLKAYNQDQPIHPDHPTYEHTFIGRGDIPRMHDREVPLQAAYKQAADDAARQIVAAIAELNP